MKLRIDTKRLHRLAYQADRRADTGRWVVACAAFHMGAISGLAADISRSEKHVYRLKLAYETYRDLRSSFGARWVRWARRELSITHFIRIGELWRHFEFEPWGAFHALDTAAANHTSVSAMCASVEGENDPNPSPEWRRCLDRALPALRAMLEAVDGDRVPAAVHAAARVIVGWTDA